MRKEGKAKEKVKERRSSPGPPPLRATRPRRLPRRLPRRSPLRHPRWPRARRRYVGPAGCRFPWDQPWPRQSSAANSTCAMADASVAGGLDFAVVDLDGGFHHFLHLSGKGLSQQCFPHCYERRRPGNPFSNRKDSSLNPLRFKQQERINGRGNFFNRKVWSTGYRTSDRLRTVVQRKSIDPSTGASPIQRDGSKFRCKKKNMDIKIKTNHS
eukprot:s2943_g5.t2